MKNNSGLILCYMTGTLITIILEASRGSGPHASDSNRDRLWVRFPLEEIKYLFSFLRSGVETDRIVGFSYSTRNASTICRKMGSPWFFLPTFLCAGYSVKLNKYYGLLEITEFIITNKCFFNVS